MEDGKQSENHLAGVLACLEAEHQKLRLELKQQEALTQSLYDLAKSQRESVYKQIADHKNTAKAALCEAVKRNHERIKGLEQALLRKKEMGEQLNLLRIKVTEKLAPQLDDGLARVKQRRESLHNKRLQVEARRQKSLNRIKEAITDHQAKTMLNKSLSSFKSQGNLSISRMTTSSSKSSVSKKNKFKVVTKSQVVQEQPAEPVSFKKPKESGYKRLKLFEHTHKKDSEEESNN